MPTDFAIAVQPRTATDCDAMTATIAVLLVPLTMCAFSIVLAVENPAFALSVAMLGRN